MIPKPQPGMTPTKLNNLQITITKSMIAVQMWQTRYDCRMIRNLFNNPQGGFSSANEPSLADHDVTANTFQLHIHKKWGKYSYKISSKIRIFHHLFITTNLV